MFIIFFYDEKNVWMSQSFVVSDQHNIAAYDKKVCSQEKSEKERLSGEVSPKLFFALQSLQLARGALSRQKYADKIWGPSIEFWSPRPPKVGDHLSHRVKKSSLS